MRRLKEAADKAAEAAACSLRRISAGLDATRRGINTASERAAATIPRAGAGELPGRPHVTTGHGAADVVGRGNPAFLAARARYTARAHQQLRADPGAAAVIGHEFRRDVHRAYMDTRSTDRVLSPAAIEKLEHTARYEAARGWLAVTNGFRVDLVVHRALATARARVARGEPAVPSSVGEAPGTNHPVLGPHKRFQHALLQLLKNDADEFWDQCRPGGRYANYHAELLRSRQFDEQVKDTWYADFERAMQKGGATPGQYTSRDNFFRDPGDDSKADLHKSLGKQTETAARLVGLFHYADPSLSPEIKQDLLQRSIPALAERAMLPRGTLARIQGPFTTEVSKLDPDPDILHSGARSALNLQPGAPVRALETSGFTSMGHCPAPNLTAPDGTSSTTALLQLSELVAPETYYRSH
ncbi:hypothetical protein [Nocardia sp. NPDC002869]|uniref:hypothetical protein n=1 Tax=Nocardia sp. NPDC002869 TaxID=3161032 RepID=UPI00398D2422